MRKHGVALAALTAVCTACGDGEDEPSLARLDVGDAAETINAEDFVRRIGVMAHDSMLGRATPSRGLDMTAEWVASELRSFGLQGGAGEGRFVQRYPLAATVADSERSSVTSGPLTLRFEVDLLPAKQPLPDREVTADLVVVSGVSDFTEAVRERLVDKHVLLVLEAGERPGRLVSNAVVGIHDAGAASVLITSPFVDEEWPAFAADVLEPSFLKAWGRSPRPNDSLPVRLHIRRRAAGRLLEGSGLTLSDLEARSEGTLRVDETGSRVTVTTATREASSSAPNVVALLEGSDPELRGEYVVFSAHMDHVGVRTPDESGDSIFNGADDDASGTVAVLEVAEAMASLETPPRRSVLFLLVSGEEKGLWGSDWFAENPTVPMESIVTNLNADMVGRNWPDTIVAIGKEHSDLGATLDRVNAEHPELRMTAIDDLWPGERFYFRSDHYNFARKGVPVLFFFNGTHDDYHGRDDEPERIDSEKASRIAKLLFYLGMEIGDATERPEWDRASYREIVRDR